jgi:DNA-binding transcriptional regulator PaaX
MWELAQVVGVTERTVHAVVADLETAGYVTRARVGRRNRYTVHLDRPYRHPAQDAHQIGPLLGLLSPAPPSPE